MKMCLASTCGVSNSSKAILPQIPYVLESFYYIKDFQIPLIKSADLFLLDSGAFTFMNTVKGDINWDAYIRKYIDFINENDVKYYFELDIDKIVGYEKVKQIRRQLETETGKQCIPVWHKSRGINEYKKMLSEYEYIAIGGFAIKDIKPQEYPLIKRIVRYAYESGVKVHGLGYTHQDVLDYAFYSCDSSSWTTCNRFGKIYKFDGQKIVCINPKNTGTKRDKQQEIEAIVLKEWIKYQKYLSKDD